MRPAALVALLALGVIPTAAPAQSALAIFEEGKRAYDAGRYAEALPKYEEAARLEPNAVRWHYHRGLALKKLRRGAEAIAAFERCRELDPAYKRPEIDKKLAELGYSPREEGSPPEEAAPSEGSRLFASIFTFLFGLACTGVSVLMVVAIVRGRRQTQVAQNPAAHQQRLQELALRLAGIERALAGRDDPQVRASLEGATEAERKVRGRLADPARADPRRIATLFNEAETLAADAEQRLAHLPPAAGTPPRIGCYFCAKPLPNPEQRFALTLSQSGQQTSALACQACAQQAQRGDPPRIQAVVRDGQALHWAQVPDYDPYLHRHLPYPGASPVGLHRLGEGSRLSEVAKLAAGGALAVGAAVAVSELIDLDSLRTSAASQAAAKALADNADRETSWRDHS